jgi:hypothetical protein
MIKVELRPFLKWVFGEELADAEQFGDRESCNFGSAWGGVEQISLLGCFVDGSSTPSDQLARRSVHPDAIAASEVVMLLAAERFELPEGWNPFPDMDDPHGLIAGVLDEVLCRRAMRDEASLNANLIAAVISFAVMGKDPEWRAEQPKFRMVEKSGKPGWFLKASHTDALGRVYEYETDGYNQKAGRPKPRAYRKFELSDPFQGFVQARIDWYLWSKAMIRVAERLQDGLSSHQIRPFEIDCEIWNNPAYSSKTVQAIENANG